MLDIRRRTRTISLWYPKIFMEGSSGWNCCTADVGWTTCHDYIVRNNKWNNGNNYHCEYGCDENCCRKRIYNSWKMSPEAKWHDFNNRYGFSDGNIDNLHYPK